MAICGMKSKLLRCNIYRNQLAIVHGDLSGHELNCACEEFGWKPARLALHDLPDAAKLLLECKHSAAWIVNEGGCAAVQANEEGSAAIVPRPCSDRIAVMCRGSEPDVLE
jgi:hypothetical protein